MEKSFNQKSLISFFIRLNFAPFPVLAYRIVLKYFLRNVVFRTVEFLSERLASNVIRDPTTPQILYTFTFVPSTVSCRITIPYKNYRWGARLRNAHPVCRERITTLKIGRFRILPGKSESGSGLTSGLSRISYQTTNPAIFKDKLLLVKILSQCKWRAVFRIHDIVVWIRILGLVPLAIRSCSFPQWPSSFFAFLFLKVHLHHSSKIESQKEVVKKLKSCVSLLFLLYDGRIRIRTTD